LHALGPYLHHFLVLNEMSEAVRGASFAGQQSSGLILQLDATFLERFLKRRQAETKIMQVTV
jgi:hypothetical protein